MQGTKATVKTPLKIQSPNEYMSNQNATTNNRSMNDDPATCCDLQHFFEPIMTTGQIALTSINVLICTPCIATCCACAWIGIGLNGLTHAGENV